MGEEEAWSATRSRAARARAGALRAVTARVNARTVGRVRETQSSHTSALSARSRMARAAPRGAATSSAFTQSSQSASNSRASKFFPGKSMETGPSYGTSCATWRTRRGPDPPMSRAMECARWVVSGSVRFDMLRRAIVVGGRRYRTVGLRMYGEEGPKEQGALWDKIKDKVAKDVDSQTIASAQERFDELKHKISSIKGMAADLRGQADARIFQTEAARRVAERAGRGADWLARMIDRTVTGTAWLFGSVAGHRTVGVAMRMLERAERWINETKARLPVVGSGEASPGGQRAANKVSEAVGQVAERVRESEVVKRGRAKGEELRERVLDSDNFVVQNTVDTFYRAKKAARSLTRTPQGSVLEYLHKLDSDIYHHEHVLARLEAILPAVMDKYLRRDWDALKDMVPEGALEPLKASVNLDPALESAARFLEISDFDVIQYSFDDIEDGATPALVASLLGQHVHCIKDKASGKVVQGAVDDLRQTRWIIVVMPMAEPIDDDKKDEPNPEPTDDDSGWTAHGATGGYDPETEEWVDNRPRRLVWKFAHISEVESLPVLI